MNTLVKLVETLAWPVSVFAISLVFRSEVRMLLGRINKFKYKEFQAEFERKLGETEREVKSLPTPNKNSQKSKKEYDAINRLIRIAEVSPRASITEAWTELEATISHVVDALSLDPRSQSREGPRHAGGRSRMPNGRMIEELVKKEFIPEELVPIYRDLRVLRNDVAHNHDLVVEFPQAERYIHLALHFSEKLQEFNKKRLTSASK